MNININIRADSADDYKAAIKALMDGAGMVGFDIPSLTLPAPRSGSVKAQQQADAEELLRKQAAKTQQQATVEAPVPSAGEMPSRRRSPQRSPQPPRRSPLTRCRPWAARWPWQARWTGSRRY